MSLRLLAGQSFLKILGTADEPPESWQVSPWELVDLERATTITDHKVSFVLDLPARCWCPVCKSEHIKRGL